MLSIERQDQPGKFRQINLGPEHDEALAKWHRIEAGLESNETTSNSPAVSCTGDGVLIGELVNAFLVALKSKIELGTASKERYRITRSQLLQFVESFGGYSVGSLRVGGVSRIETWLSKQENWCRCRPDVVKRIKHLFNWATQEGYLLSSPVKALKKGKYGQREKFFTPEQEVAILAAGNPFFARGFKMLMLTGCRPDEICTLEAKHVYEDEDGLFLLIEHKNQRYTGKPRRVFLVAEAVEIIRDLLKQYPKGRLFRSLVKTNENGYRELSSEYFSHVFRKVCRRPECVKLGLNTFTKVGKKRLYDFVPYCARHTYAVRWLTGYNKDRNGKPIILTYGEVAVLLGNSAVEVERTYGHLLDQTKFLTDRIRGTFGA